MQNGGDCFFDGCACRELHAALLKMPPHKRINIKKVMAADNKVSFLGFSAMLMPIKDIAA